MTLEDRFNPISSLNESQLTPLNHYGPVTALKIHNEYVLAGNGSILKVFKVDQNSKTTLIFNKQVLKRNKIHNISISPSRKYVIINGGRSFVVLDFKILISNNLDQFAIIEKAVNEWIITAEFISDDILLILNSHNTVYKLDVSSPDQHFKLLDKIHCNEKSILYSGSITKISDEKVIIAAGTVMNGCIIWELNSKTILHNLTEHEGSIFGVKVDSEGKYIISCSDDRSIKLYDFESGHLFATGWGHGSRIWNLSFFKDTTNGVKIMSAGEDCTLRIWKYIPNQETLQQLELWEDAHRGKHIWSADIDDTNLKVCVSGGADGKIRLHDLSNRGQLTNYNLSFISEQCKIAFKKKEVIKSFTELEQLNLLILVTSGGSIILVDQIHNKFKSVDLSLDEHQKLDGFGLIQSFSDINVVTICSVHGDLLFLKFTDFDSEPTKSWIDDSILGKNKVTNFMVASKPNSNLHYLFIDCPNPRIPFILREFKFDEGIFELQRILLLEQPNQTSFTTTSMSIDFTNNWLFVASRYVSLAAYDLNTTKLESIPLSALHKKISAGDSITSISIIESKENEITLLTIVRDGIYMYIKFDQHFKMSIVHKNHISRGFIEGGYLKDNELILYGFKSSAFYIWNETRQLEITNVLCGGANRLWKVIKYSTGLPLDYKFLFINKSELNIFEFKGRFIDDRFGLINDGTHGREIRDVSISPSLFTDNSRLIMSASEDTTLNLSKLYQDGAVKNIWNINRHVSGLQRIKFLNDTYVASSAANEEFYIWKLDTFNKNIPLVVEYAKLAPSIENPDVRIMDFASIPLKEGFLIATGYSNSDIKLWYFNTETAKFELLVSDTYSTFCILNIDILTFDDKIYIQTTTTDGFFSIFEASEAIESQSLKVPGFDRVIIKQELHQNAVKAVFLKKINENHFKVFTGGDDNALVLSEIIYDGSLNFKTLSFVEDAASSTITSISEGIDETIIVTSVDQILRKWSYKGDSLQCASAVYTTIADTGCSDSTTFNNEKLIVAAGAGLSSWKI
ncbi:WD40-repeat-containing domain protein [Scheffersomyces coipomensis]|uniref:WD40-repeat-containing domain protein n=1 Tax=Scheffersomyces coipomensis TaxID=1788519 RepID=UPI00315CB999